MPSLPSVPQAVKDGVKLTALAVWLADSYHVYRYVEDYYREDNDDTYDDDRLAEDRRVLALYADDCAPASLVDKATFDAALEHLRNELKTADPSEGMWSPDDPALKVLAESAAFLGGARATFLQLAQPFIAQGIKLHSKLESGVRGRFMRTFKYVFGMNFGTQGEMFQAARTVRALHEPVHGEISEQGSNVVFTTGSKFNAHQVHAIRWVASTLVETAIFQYEMIVNHLSEAEKDHLVKGGSKMLRLFGVVPDQHDPQTWREFRRMHSAMWRSPALQVSRGAKETAEFLLLPPSVLNQPLLDMVWWTTFVTMPPKLGSQFYGRSVSWFDKVLFALWTGLVRFVYRLLPKSFRQLAAYTQYRKRTRGLWPHESALAYVSATATNVLLDQAMPERDPEVARVHVMKKLDAKAF